MEHLSEVRPTPGQVKAVLFDFDGTLSTLRCGWEDVMLPMMVEYMGGGEEEAPELEALVREYIDASTGIQTVYQMRWLAQQAEQRGVAGGKERDEWWYKDEYNRRLMAGVDQKKEALRSGKAAPEDYLVAGSEALLEALRGAGLRLFVASGTDHPDVVAEAELLGLAPFFTLVRGAPPRQAACSKEAVMQLLLEEEGLAGGQLAVVGDGKVEIALGRDLGAVTLGVASDEAKGQGVDPAKHRRLTAAGAHAIVPHFAPEEGVAAFLLGREI